MSSATCLQLYTHREDVDLVNGQLLAALPAQAVRYVAQDSGASLSLLTSACPVSDLPVLQGASCTISCAICTLPHSVNLSACDFTLLQPIVLQRLPPLFFCFSLVSLIGSMKWCAQASCSHSPSLSLCLPPPPCPSTVSLITRL